MNLKTVSYFEFGSNYDRMPMGWESFLHFLEYYDLENNKWGNYDNNGSFFITSTNSNRIRPMRLRYLLMNETHGFYPEHPKKEGLNFFISKTFEEHLFWWFKKNKINLYNYNDEQADKSLEKAFKKWKSISFITYNYYSNMKTFYENDPETNFPKNEMIFKDVMRDLYIIGSPSKILFASDFIKTESRQVKNWNNTLIESYNQYNEPTAKRIKTFFEIEN